MKYLIRDRAFYKTFIKISAALALQQLLNYGVNLADNVMLGAYSEAAMSGSAVVSQLQYILQLLIKRLRHRYSYDRFTLLGHEKAGADTPFYRYGLEVCPYFRRNIYCGNSGGTGHHTFSFYQRCCGAGPGKTVSEADVLDLYPLSHLILPYVGPAQC